MVMREKRLLNLFFKRKRLIYKTKVINYIRFHKIISRVLKNQLLISQKVFLFLQIGILNIYIRKRNKNDLYLLSF